MRAPDDFVLVIGNSHVRTFAACRSFLPVFMGPGRLFCFIDDATGNAIADSVVDLLGAIGGAPPVLFVFSEPEIRLHLESRDGDPSADDHFADAVARRYRSFLASVRRVWRSPIAVLGSIPRISGEYNALAATVNARLRAMCESEGIPFVDPWPAVVDAQSGALRSELDADGIHMDFAAAPLFSRQLKSMNFLDRAASEASDYRFADRHEFRLPSGNSVRVWGDIRLNVGSAAKSSTSENRLIAGALVPHLSSGETVTIFGAREGFLAFHLAQLGNFRVIAVEPDPVRRGMAERLAAVFAFAAPSRICADLPGTLPEALVVLNGGAFGDGLESLKRAGRWPRILVLPATLWRQLAGHAHAVLYSATEVSEPGSYIIAARSPD